MYEGVHAYPDGASTVGRLALTASEYGYDGVVVRSVEIRAADPSQASGFVGNHREDATIVAVHGGDPVINRFAVEQPAVDVLAHPMAGDGEFNHVLAREAAENGVRVEVSLKPVLHRDGGQRVRDLRALRKLWEILDHYGTPYVVSTDPGSHLGLRAPRELQALGSVVGIDADDVAAGLAEWGRLAERNRERSSASFVEPGVWTRDGREANDNQES
ncbi:MAG: ribonuclease P [Halobacteriales archaeon SW_9_67_25]|nr:MAG: ribonuclease P [Halobacteriales archaeon SW_9_67_25]